MSSTAAFAPSHTTDNVTDPAVLDANRLLLTGYSSSLQVTHITNLFDSISYAYLAQVESATCEVDEEDQHTFMARKMPLAAQRRHVARDGPQELPSVLVKFLQRYVELSPRLVLC